MHCSSSGSSSGAGGSCTAASQRAAESEVQTFLSCTLNPHFFRRDFCMLRYTQLYSNPCISCIFWLHHACRSTAAHAPGSGRAAADEQRAWRTAGICAAFTHNSPDLRTSSGGPELSLKSGELCGKTRHTFFRFYTPGLIPW